MPKRNKHYIQSMVKIGHSNLVECGLFLFIFVFSLIVGSRYVGSDQKYYREVYNQLRKYGLIKGYLYYSISLDSFEIIHYLVDWVFCRILPKDIVMSVFNSLLGVCLYKILRKWGADRINALFVTLTNYYILVLYFAAERLKFGFLLVAIGLLEDNLKIRDSLFLFSIFAHVQMAILFISAKMQAFVRALTRLVLNARISVSVLISAIMLCVVIFLMSNQLISKFMYYRSEDMGIMDIVKIMMFFLASLVFSKNKSKVIYAFLPLLVATLIVGSFRTNIFAYFLMLYFCIPYKRGYNLAVWLTNIYYLIMSVDFLTQIFRYGRAFLAN